MNKLAYFDCVIRRCFSPGERSFYIVLGGITRYSHRAPVDLFWALDGRKLGLDEPKKGEFVDGLVRLPVNRLRNGTVEIGLSDRRIVTVPLKKFKEEAVSPYWAGVE